MQWLEFISTTPSAIQHPDKDKILVFMRHGFIRAAAPGIVKDIVTGRSIPGEMLWYEGNGFSWTSMDIWYLDTYNFELPDEFVKTAKEHYLDHIRERKFG